SPCAVRWRPAPPFDQLLGRIPVEAELQIQPTGVDLHQPAHESERLDRLRRVGGVFGRRGPDAPATGHAGECDDPRAERSEVVEVDTWPTAICTGQQSAIRQADQ